MQTNLHLHRENKEATLKIVRRGGRAAIYQPLNNITRTMLAQSKIIRKE